MVVIRALDMERKHQAQCPVIVDSQFGDSNIPKEDMDSFRAPCNAKMETEKLAVCKDLCVDNYLATIHNDLFVDLRLSISPLEPLVCVYSRFVHIDIEES